MQGASLASDVFNEQIQNSIRNQSNIRAVVEDFIIFSDSKEEHLKHVEEILRICADHNQGSDIA